MQIVKAEGISTQDMVLIEDALAEIRFVQSGTSIPHPVMVTLLAEEIRRGRREAFSLARAGRKILDRQQGGP